MTGPAALPSGRIVPVVILNWNGEADTIGCLESIRRGQPAGFLPVLVDNGSEPASVARLEAACRRIYPRVVELKAPELAALPPVSGDDVMILIASGENLGFAKGSNLGVRVAERLGSDWMMLLNNDTVVEPDTFARLRAFLDGGPTAVAVTAQIRYFEPGTRIQNCGGDLTYLGSWRYRWPDVEASALPAVTRTPVTFATGCALLFNYRVTGPLTEDFFFGEEDYEFALRLRKRGLEMICLHGAVVHHKVGTTVARATRPVGGILYHYVSRLIDVRNYYSRPRWQLTRLAAYAWLPVLLARQGVSPLRMFDVIRRIESYLRTHRGVTREDFQAMIGTS